MKRDISIELFLLCFNEEKMILHTLNYYSKFCDKINIIDNDSTDNSIKLATEFDPNINIIRLNSNGEYREDFMIDMRNKCWKNSHADFVIVCDMDEFLYDENLIDKLLYAKRKEISIPIVYGYNMFASKFPDNYNLLITNQIKSGIRDRLFDKSIIFNPKKVKNINFGPGSHTSNPEFYSENELDTLVELKLLHYKYLDKEYLYVKHGSYSKRMSSINKERKWGYEYLLGNKFIDKVFTLTGYLIKVLK